MSGLFASNNQGLFNASLPLLGGLGGQARFGHAAALYVNVANGNAVLQGEDRTLSGVGDEVGLLRTYNSLGGVGGAALAGWRLTGES